MREIHPRLNTEAMVSELELRLGANCLVHVLAIQGVHPSEPRPIADKMRLGVVFLGHALAQLPPYNAKALSYKLKDYQLWNIAAKDTYLKLSDTLTLYEPNLSDISKSEAYMPHRTLYEDYAAMMDSLVTEDGQPVSIVRGEAFRGNAFSEDVYEGNLGLSYEPVSLIGQEAVREIIGGGIYRDLLLGEVPELRKAA